jgi:hypothetical protein
MWQWVVLRFKQVHKLKHCVTILFLLLTSYTWIAKAIIVIDFQVHQQQLAARYCENKEKPAMQCHGKCHLVKQLQKTEENGKRLPANLFNGKAELFTITNHSLIFVAPLPSCFTYPNLTTVIPDGYPRAVARPPSPRG